MLVGVCRVDGAVVVPPIPLLQVAPFFFTRLSRSGMESPSFGNK